MGGTLNPDRKEAFGMLKIFPSLGKAAEWVAKREKETPLLVGTTARPRAGSFHWLEVKRRILKEKKPVVFVFGTGSGLTDEVLEKCGVVLDRFFGWR